MMGKESERMIKARIFGRECKGFECRIKGRRVIVILHQQQLGHIFDRHVRELRVSGHYDTAKILI